MANVMDKLMTWEEQLTKEEIMDRLGQQGYPSYAHLLDKFAVHLTEDPDVVAYMIPDKGIIVLNRYLSLRQCSTIVRHEILHQYLDHMGRQIKKLGEESTQDASLAELTNIAGDYDISNVGYTDADKANARSIYLDGKIVQGLVTEDQHPEWVNLSYEEMIDELMKEQKKNGSQSQQAKGQAWSGNKGNAQKQAAEAAARAAQIASEQAQDKAEESNNPEDKKAAEEAMKAAEEAKQKAKDLIDKINQASGQEKSDDKGDEGEGNNGKGKPSGKDDKSSGKGSTEPLETPLNDYPLTKEDLNKINERLAEIQDLLKDAGMGQKVKSDSIKAKRKEIDDRRKAKEDEYKNNPLTRFVSSLNGFIEKQIEYNRGKTWKKLNPTYADTGILKQVITSQAMNAVPVVQVYYDNSGSWDSSKQSVGARGIDSLQKYVKEGLLKVEKYYFGNRVSKDKDKTGGGTEGVPIQENILATKPDNVIVITDSDINDCRDVVQVPGAVWFLFVNGVSNNLKEHLKGKMLTKSYEINA